MGRLQRKKPATQKKKKKQQLEDAGQATVDDKSDVSLAEKAKNDRKKSAPVAKKTSGGTTKPVPVKREKNFIDKSIQFLREVRIELKKVTWPTKKQTLGSTVVVIILVSLIAMFLGVIDVGLSGLIRLVLPQ